MADPPKPILFIAFANDVENPARNLTGLQGEFDNIRAAFASVTAADDSCELLAHVACTGEGLVEPFYRNQVVIFHYAGHASPDSLLLQTADGHNAPASRKRFEDFLALQSRLRLVFLNACMTRDWAAALVDQGVCVVATSRSIEDSVAPRFAHNFYNQIAQGRSIAEAFEVVSKGCASAEEHQVALRGVAAAENDHATDGLPWALYGSESAKRWRLSDDADDPTIGLPPLDLEKYPPPPDGPYVSLEGHQPEHARVFFGRNAEIRQLYDWVTTPTTTPVLLFYGQSGAGKSSLLRAGLQPRLDSVGRVQYLRRGTDLCADLEKAIAAACEGDAEWVGSREPNLIVLDQIEEALTHGTADELAALADRLKALFAHRPPGSKSRLILSFRKEYLAEIGSLLRDKLPALTTKLFLERLSQKAVRQVVLGPVRSEVLRSAYPLKISEEFADFLAIKLEDHRGSVAIVLQIVLRRMWEEGSNRAGEGRIEPLEFDEKLFARVIDDEHGPLKQFLDEQIEALRRNWQAEVEGGLELDLLLEHTTDHMTARRRTLEELEALYPARETLRQLLEENKRLHLLSEAQEDGTSARATTLAHDQLALVVRAEWNLSQLAGARARRIVENRARSWGESKRGDLLDGGDLRVVERGLEQMRALTDANHETEMLAASRESRRKRRQAWIIWPTVTAMLIGGIFGLAQANRSARDRIGNLATLAGNTLGKDDFTALLLSMQAAVEARNSWALRVAPEGKLRADVQSALANSLQTDHESGRYPFNYLAFWSDNVGDCATSLDGNGRLLFRTSTEENAELLTTVRHASLAGKKVPDDLLAGSSRLTCDPSTARMAGFAFDTSGDPVKQAFVTTWSGGEERKATIGWELSLGLPLLMSVDGNGGEAALGFDDKPIIVLADLKRETVETADPGVGIPTALSFAPDNSALVVTGPRGMTWFGSNGSTLLHCPGNYGTIRFARAGSQGFAAVLSKPDSQHIEMLFWKLPLTAGLGSAGCQPFDFDASSTEYVDPTAVAFQGDGTRFALAGRDAWVDLYPTPATLTRASVPTQVEKHNFGDVAPYLPSVDDSSSLPVQVPVYYLGLNGNGTYYATHQEKESMIRVWPTQRTMPRLADWRKSVPNPDSADHLLALACSELKVYLNEDDGFRVNPAAGQGVDLHALQAGCARVPQLRGR